MLQEQKHLLALLAACFNEKDLTEEIPQEQWADIFRLAQEHTVVSLAFAGTQAVRDQIPAELTARWRGLMLNIMMQNNRINAAEKEILGLMEEAGLPCVILKGSSFSVCYPQPDLRLLGDIDLLTRPEDGEKIKEILEKAGFHAPETDHPFHIDYYRKGVVLEIHYAASTFPDTPGGNKAKACMADCLSSVQKVPFSDFMIPVLSPAHQALSALLHMERHMTTISISLRQVYDWAAFVASVPVAQFTEEVLPVLEDCGLARFAQVITKTCIRYLGMDAALAPWCAKVENSMTEAMMEEILRAGNLGQSPESDDVSNILVDRNGSSNYLKNLISFLSTSSRKQFPITKKLPILLPFFWIYLPLRFWVRSLLGLRQKKSLSHTVYQAKKRSKLYRKLRLFDAV